MVNLTKLETVVCRPALEKDTEDMLELCSHIWEGGDYIPLVWKDWLADPDGLLGVAELYGRVVGIFKLAKFDEQEWYMEGLRVHPDFEGRGIAAHIHQYVLDTWHRMGSGVIRLVTGSYNVKVQRMCEQSGFKRVAEFVFYRAEILQEDTDHFNDVTPEEAAKAYRFVMDSPSHALSRCLVNLGWVYANPQPKHILEAIGEGHAWWWKGGAGFLSIWEDREAEEHEPGIQLIACRLDDLAEFLTDYRRLMAKMGYKSASWVAPNQPEALAALEKAGFALSWDKSLYIYELDETAGRD